MCFTLCTLWDLWLAVPKAGGECKRCGTNLSGSSLYKALFEAMQWKYNFLRWHVTLNPYWWWGEAAWDTCFCWNRYWWGQLKWWYDGDEWHCIDSSPKKGLDVWKAGSVQLQHRLQLTKAYWCEISGSSLWPTPSTACGQVCGLRRGGTIVSDLWMKNENVDGMQLPWRGFWFILYCVSDWAEWN